jgi:GT2 family glycosyltransferase
VTASIDISIVLVHRNGTEMLRNCLASLPGACEGLRHEILLIDNGSSDDSVAMVRREFPQVRLRINKANTGFTRANNQGIKSSRGRVVALLNNDTICHPRAFAVLVRELDSNPNAGIVAPKLLNSDGSRQFSFRSFPGFQQALFNRESLLTRYFPNNPYSSNYLRNDDPGDEPQEVDWASGACLVIRRELIDRIGGLDEGFFMYSEDVDYCLRAWHAGYRVLYRPEAVVTHLGGQTSARTPFRPIYERHRSMYRFYKKHYSRELLFLDAATALVVTMRCLTQLAMESLRRLSPSQPQEGKG